MNGPDQSTCLLHRLLLGSVEIWTCLSDEQDDVVASHAPQPTMPDRINPDADPSRGKHDPLKDRPGTTTSESGIRSKWPTTLLAHLATAQSGSAVLFSTFLVVHLAAPSVSLLAARRGGSPTAAELATKTMVSPISVRLLKYNGIDMLRALRSLDAYTINRQRRRR